ncbi:LexA family protein [Burkholderia gladioli]|uniref:LexA family protein n=1 Tax=Burkholderia gladioli TaxID=28095 RepID=UPI00164111B4|nr:XRE family transcriptional regulator [Burkholderia gladioli]
MESERGHIGTRIRQLREARGLTLQDVANVFGITRASVSEWEHGRSKPDTAKLTKLADMFDTTVTYLLDGTPVPLFKPEGRGRVYRFAPPDSAAAQVDETESNVAKWPSGKLPLISWVQAGAWSEIVDNFQPGDAEDWIACPFPSGNHGFVLRVVGDSMADPTGGPSFREGDFISVNPDRSPLHRSLVIARRDGKATFKQLLLEADGSALLFALNPEWPNRYIPVDGQTEIIGVVTGQWRSLI